MLKGFGNSHVNVKELMINVVKKFEVKHTFEYKTLILNLCILNN